MAEVLGSLLLPFQWQYPLRGWPHSNFLHRGYHQPKTVFSFFCYRRINLPGKANCESGLKLPNSLSLVLTPSMRSCRDFIFSQPGRKSSTHRNPLVYIFDHEKVGLVSKNNCKYNPKVRLKWVVQFCVCDRSWGGDVKSVRGYWCSLQFSFKGEMWFFHMNITWTAKMVIQWCGLLLIREVT